MKNFSPTLPNTKEVHVWHINLDAGRSVELANVLTGDEVVRANRFVFDRHRDRFICGRSAMRCILGEYLGIVASEVAIEYGPNGKPVLGQRNGNNTQLGFNLAHSESLAVLAVGGARAIGIDIELMRALKDIGALAKSVFSEEENAQFQATAVEFLTPTFFTCWTRKEALLKALGTGLTLEANSMHVGIGSGSKRITLPTELGGQSIAIETIERGSAQHTNAVASLAVIGEIERVLHFDYVFESPRQPLAA
jgi:4'-phosphopantetheinyl transferase